MYRFDVKSQCVIADYPMFGYTFAKVNKKPKKIPYVLEIILLLCVNG